LPLGVCQVNSQPLFGHHTLLQTPISQYVKINVVCTAKSITALVGLLLEATETPVATAALPIFFA
jgi:hypothetical protein